MPILTTNGPKPTSLPPGTLLGYIIIAVVSAILLGGLIYALSREPPPIVDSVGCLKDDPPPELIAIIIDRTDPLSSVQAATVINGLKTIKAGEDRQDDDDPLPRWTEFRAYTVGSVLEQTREMNFRACFPGRPEDVDITTESYRRAVAQWKKFNEKFEQYLGGITPSGSESESPLIESIRSVGATTFSDPQFNSDPKTRKRLIIVSDMLQNSALFSHYRVWLNCRTDVVGAIERCVEKNPKKGEECTMFGGRRSQTCERSVVTKLDYGYWKNRLGTRLNSELRDVEVEVFYVRRDGAAQQGGGAHMTFWEDYFEDNGAKLVHLRSID